MTLYTCIVRSRRETDGIRLRSEPRQSHDMYSGQECGVPAFQAPKTRPCLASEEEEVGPAISSCQTQTCVRRITES